MSNALKNVNTRQTSQMERTVGRTDEVKNNAGGYVFKVSDKSRLERFLILGVDGGTYYVSERDITKQNVDFLLAQAQNDARALVDTVVAVSDSGRAAKNSPALFAMAVTLTYCKPEDKAYVRANVGKVARTSTHLFEFAQYLENLGGWGRAKRGAIADWYTGKSADQLAYQAVKYRQRNGWTHRDLFRLSHPTGVDTLVGDFILGKAVHEDIGPDRIQIISAFKEIQAAGNVEQVVAILDANKNLPWEAVPTEYLNDVKVWQTMFENDAIGQTALLRNVSRLEKAGAFKDLVFARQYADRLANPERIAKGRVHPIAYLNALGVYRDGKMEGRGYGYGTRSAGNGTTPAILDALEAGYYAGFASIEPSNKRTRIAIDTSGSMTWHGPAGLVGLDCRQAAAAFAMSLIRTEPYVDVIGFGGNVQRPSISAADSLESVTRKIDQLPMGRTDCALPMVDALKSKTAIDHFVIVTDNETWAGQEKPHESLRRYRDSMGIDAKVTVVGMVSTEFSIADDSGNMLDVVGFDTNAPRIITDFAAHRI